MTPDGIAVITISGTLVKKASWMDAESGLQSYETIRTDARGRPRRSAVSGASCSTWTRLAVRSAGCSISRTRCTPLREQKPCYAIANDEAFSAAYALASSAQRLFVTRTGGVGSIGVIAVHMDQSGWDEKMGRKYTAVYAGARKNDFSTHQPLSDDARANLQGEIDRLYEMFVASVARNRGLAPALVRKTDAGLFWGEKAISAGLADQVGSFDDALAAVTQASRSVQASLAQRRLPRRRSKERTRRIRWLKRPKRNRQTLRPRRCRARCRTETAAEVPAAAAAPPPRRSAPEPAAAPPAAPAVDAAAIEARIRGEHEEIARSATAGRLDLGSWRRPSRSG